MTEHQNRFQIIFGGFINGHKYPPYRNLIYIVEQKFQKRLQLLKQEPFLFCADAVHVQILLQTSIARF